jgi:hypothetical protein
MTYHHRHECSGCEREFSCAGLECCDLLFKECGCGIPSPVLLYAITKWVGPKIITVIPKALWVKKIQHWLGTDKGMNVEFLIVEK